MHKKYIAKCPLCESSLDADEEYMYEHYRDAFIKGYVPKSKVIYTCAICYGIGTLKELKIKAKEKTEYKNIVNKALAKKGA